MSIDPPIQVSISDRFASEVRQLAKRYRRIRIDIQPIIEQLEAGEAEGVTSLLRFSSASGNLHPTAFQDMIKESKEVEIGSQPMQAIL